VDPEEGNRKETMGGAGLAQIWQKGSTISGKTVNEDSKAAARRICLNSETFKKSISFKRAYGAHTMCATNTPKAWDKRDREING